jgi:multidrug resistance efflux pump
VRFTPRETPGRRLRLLPPLITLATIALAVSLGWATWVAYVGASWTRDATMRVYVVTMAPGVAERIARLPVADNQVADNQFVHKGAVLMVIDPINFKIGVSLAEAAVQQAQVNAQNAEREAKRRHELTLKKAVLESGDMRSALTRSVHPKKMVGHGVVGSLSAHPGAPDL